MKLGFLFVICSALTAQAITTNQVDSQKANAANLQRCLDSATASAATSFDNAGKNDKCFIPLKFICALFGHGDKSSPEWFGDGVNFTSAAKHCYDNYRITALEENNNIAVLSSSANPTGQSSFVADTSGASNFEPGKGDGSGDGSASSGQSAYIDKNGIFHGKDGSNSFGLDDGAIMNHVLKGGDIVDLLSTSPGVKKMAPGIWDQMKSRVGPNNTIIAAGSGIANETNGNAENADAKAAEAGDAITFGSGTEEGQLAGATSDGSVRFGQSAAASSRTPASADGARRYPGDKTIFEIVSSKIREKSPGMMDMNDFIRNRKVNLTRTGGV